MVYAECVAWKWLFEMKWAIVLVTNLWQIDIGCWGCGLECIRVLCPVYILFRTRCLLSIYIFFNTFNASIIFLNCVYMYLSPRLGSTMHSHCIQLQMGVEVQLFSYIRSRLVGHSPHGPPLSLRPYCSIWLFALHLLSYFFLSLDCSCHSSISIQMVLNSDTFLVAVRGGIDFGWLFE